MPQMAYIQKEVHYMFAVDEIVLYGNNGVCKITEITNKNIGSYDIEYYVLKPICSETSTLFVPTANKQLVSKMRYLTPINEINALIDTDIESNNIWIDNKNDRVTTFKEIIAKAKLSELISLMRTILLHEQKQIAKGKRLHISDERLLREVEKMVCDEISVVLNIDRDSVLSLVMKK